MPDDFEKLDQLLDEARQEYRQYLDNHPDPGGVQERLNWVRTLHDWARIQFNAIRALWLLRYIRHTIFNQEFLDYENKDKEFSERLSTASEYMENHRQWNGKRSTSIAKVKNSTYEAKVLQLQNALHGLSFASESLDDYVPVSKALVDLLSRYVDDPAGVEATTFEDVLANLGEIQTDIEEFHCSTSAVDGFLEVYRGAISAASDGVAHLQDAAAAARNDDSDKRIEYEKQAKSAFRDSELLVSDQSKTGELIDQLT